MAGNRILTRSAMTAFCLMIALTLAVASPVEAQKKKKNGDKEPTEPTIVLADPQQIETNISEMLAAWQIGDVALLHKYYADDVTVVSGTYEPPLVGWANYAAAYQRQRERIQSVRMERRNTLVQVKGTVAWAVYQWEMSATADGNPFNGRGHTTLTLEKRGGTWLIVHNHTSMVESLQPSQQAQQKPAESNPPKN